MSGLIWIQAVWHSDGIPERFFLKKVDFEKNQQSCKMTQKQRVKSYDKHYVKSTQQIAIFNEQETSEEIGCLKYSKIEWRPPELLFQDLAEFGEVA